MAYTWVDTKLGKKQTIEEAQGYKCLIRGLAKTGIICNLEM